MQHSPRRRFGQNFLIDRGVIADIVGAIAPSRDDLMVEIGPGLGALTDPLLRILDRLHVIEIDRDLVTNLARVHPPERLIVHAGDALEFDFAMLGSGLRLVGNLPYNISTPLLFHVARFGSIVRDTHFMLQKEVVDRMVATAGSGDVGRLSIMLQYRFAMEKLIDVPPDAFDPAPKVTSALVRMLPLDPLPHPARDERLFAQLVTRAFTQRRKTLRNALATYLTAAELATIDIDPGARAETLDVASWVRAADCVVARELRQPFSG